MVAARKVAGSNKNVVTASADPSSDSATITAKAVDEIAEGAGHGGAHAKVILIGEHSVVHGAPAIAFPMKQIGLYATARPTAPGAPLRLTVDVYDGPTDRVPDRIRPLVTTIEATLDALGLPHSGLVVTCDGDIPLERGLGSSAAGAMAIVNAITDLVGADLSEETRFDLVQAGEKVAHGQPSGLDAHTVVRSRPIWFEKGAVELIDFRLGAPLVVADTGVAGDTSSAVGSISAALESDPENTQALIAALRDHTAGAREDLATDNRASLGAHLSAAHRILRELNVSSTELDHLVAAALQAGALGAKLTGGGRGGCMIALARDAEHCARLAAELRLAGAVNTWTIRPEEL